MLRFFYNLLKRFENLRGWISIFLLNMQNCPWTLDKSISFFFICFPGRYIVRVKPTVTRSAHIRSGSHLFSLI